MISLPVNSRIFDDDTLITISQDLRLLLEKDTAVEAEIFKTIYGGTGWTPYTIQVNSTTPTSITTSLVSNSIISTYTRVVKILPVTSLISSALGVITSREANTTYKIYLDGGDVTSKVKSCNVVYSRDSFCGQVDIEWADWSYFTQLDCTDMPNNFKQERFSVYMNDVLLGRFLNEKRDVSVSFEETRPTSWGRTKTAFLTGPYTVPIIPSVKEWNTDSTALAICQELAAIEGITLRWEILDFKVRGGKFVMEEEYPIDGIKRLAASIGGIVTTSRFSPELVVRYKWIF